MLDYSYNKDYPFAALITNLGKHNEGELVGERGSIPDEYSDFSACQVFRLIFDLNIPKHNI